ncbi:MAG: molybdenum cofactor biosynthesis protein B [Alphaproteobacteria bacterium]|nr:molybdenum cofactor biosynthesis protein B [Alphaproteobacteria bacterium]
MNRIDEARAFIPVRIAVLTISDTRIEAEDKSGALLVQRLSEAGHVLAEKAIVRDDIPGIRAVLSRFIADPQIDAVITTGGTGLTGRDVTVEAVMPLFDKVIEGFAAVFHQISYASVGTSTMQSRACAGVANGTYVFCLPGSSGAVKDGWDGILRYQLDARHRPCNFVEIMPRLNEHKPRATP